MIVADCPTTVMDASRTLTSYCPPTNTIAAIGGTCPIGIIVLADDRRIAWRATLFFGASARGILDLPALQVVKT
jgi:hypothetical protein